MNSKRTASVLVTGGAGFIGSNLVRELTRLGTWRITVLDDLSTGFADNLTGLPDVRQFYGSILDHDILRAAMRDVDAIVHLGALGSVPRSIEHPLATHSANVTGTVMVLEEARRIGAQVIFSSSSSVYGQNPELPKRESMTPMPKSPYAVSKLAAEQYVCVYGQQFGIPVLALRLFNVYGPLQRAGHAYTAVIPRFLDAIKNGSTVTIHGDGTQTRDFTYVSDVVRVIVSALESGAAAPWPVNLAFGRRITLLDVLDQLEAISGQKVKRRFEAPRLGDVAHSQGDSSALQLLVGELNPTPIEAGLRLTADWFLTD